MRRHIHGVDRKLDIHVAFDFAPSGRVDELLRWFRHDRVTIIVKPVDQWPNGRIFLIVDESRIVEGSNQATFSLKFS